MYYGEMGAVNGLGDGEEYRPVAGGYRASQLGEEPRVGLAVHFTSFPPSKS